MIYNNLKFHNVAELEVVEGMPGYRLQRFPKYVRNNLGYKEQERGRFYSQCSTGCEIRFVTDAKFFRIALSAVEGEGTVLVYRGNFLHSYHHLKAGTITTLNLQAPPAFSEVCPEALEGYAFSPSVWRLLFDKNCCAVFHYIDTFGHEIRPPMEGEIPKVKWLAYGSSITFGGDCNLYSNSYVQQVGRRLGVDILNKAIAGACFCDESVANYIAQFDDWDFTTLELGVNMRELFSAEEYEKRINYLLDTIMSENPDKPIVVIGIYPNGAGYFLEQENITKEHNREFDIITKKIVEEKGSNKLFFIAGDKILTDFSGLCTDLLHPSDDGHILMGENLSKELRRIIGEQ